MATPKKPIPLTPTATLLEKAVLAKEQNPKIAPRLLLEALRQRIRRGCARPGSRPLVCGPETGAGGR